MTYLYVALGGALGSVARAWISVLMVRVTGPGFPWGTIAINIVGSFVIAFFGVLTAADSRFPASAETRAFVMVGICGGFTTFSSFSLQTLDLLREGRPGQALGNIALSLVLCLAAVSLGFYAGQSVSVENAALVQPAEDPDTRIVEAAQGGQNPADDGAPAPAQRRG